MKFTLPLTILAVAVSVDAVAVIDQDKRFCSAEGQACDTVKRAADAFSDAVQQNGQLAARDETQSETAWIARRQLHELALAIAASHENPAAFYSALGFDAPPPTGTEEEKPTEKREAEPWCTQFLGMPCWKRSESGSTTEAAETRRDADASPWCTQFLGMPCWKRSEPSAEAVEKRDAEPWCKQFLGMPCWKRDAGPWCKQFLGMPCWKRDEKREAEAEPDRFCTRFMGSSCWKRDGSAAANDDVKRCTSEGQSCWKAKRAAAAVVNAIDQGNALKMAREAGPWCKQLLGMPCWKRAATCHSPEGVCTKATRDLHAMYNAARTIIEA
ncbi:hypothetical protein C8A00DRAFT_35864 [Chaetomidium leptoderma]|uniref:Uncharacterized protein n=1 Tax=Chaetomidium leptoderma TaxID=669021 RepID=A0AAN6VHC1_9PEZI|nr:hypothetical protein C8A00DRAFT_35864 [Chaetomidium leptoderma]